jgi:hypothetical protein
VIKISESLAMLTEECGTFSGHVLPIYHVGVNYFCVEYIHNLCSKCDILYVFIVDEYIYILSRVFL